LVDLFYDFLIRFEKLLAEIQDLKEDVKGLRLQKTVATVPFHLLMNYSGSKIKAFGKKAIKNRVDNPAIRAKHSLCHLILKK